jgi:precorrin-3B synthase
MNPLRRGACPGISQPLPTGDGLLARLMPSAPIPLDALVALCDASQAYGNGIVEVTQRGSLQIRGLSPASAPVFARTAVALGLGAEGGPPLLTSPLMGLEAQERVELRDLIGALRTELTRNPDVASIGPKVSLLIDGGGALHLDDVPGDLRLRASTASRWHLSIAETVAASTSLGWIEPENALQGIVHVLASIASRGADARARDLTNVAEVAALRASLAGILTDEPPPNPRAPAEPIGTHVLNNGQVALGVALAFGYIEAGILKRFVLAAARGGASSIRPAPGRALLTIGLAAAAANELAAAAVEAGFVLRPDDPRRYVVACAGAPACGSAMLATRQLAPAIAQAARPFLDGSLTLHVSGCAKGCAHPHVAALTILGPDRLVVQGRAGDTPHGTTSAAEFIAGLARLDAERQHWHGTEECSADMLSRLGATRVLALMNGEPVHD